MILAYTFKVALAGCPISLSMSLFVTTTQATALNTRGIATQLRMKDAGIMVTALPVAIAAAVCPKDMAVCASPEFIMAHPNKPPIVWDPT